MRWKSHVYLFRRKQKYIHRSKSGNGFQNMCRKSESNRFILKNGRGYTLRCQSTKRWLRSNIGFKVLQIAQTVSSALHRCSPVLLVVSVRLTWAVPRQPYQPLWEQFGGAVLPTPKTSRFRSLSQPAARMDGPGASTSVVTGSRSLFTQKLSMAGCHQWWKQKANSDSPFNKPLVFHPHPHIEECYSFHFPGPRTFHRRDREREKRCEDELPTKTPPSKNFREGKTFCCAIFARVESISWVLFCCCLPSTLDRILVLSLA